METPAESVDYPYGQLIFPLQHGIRTPDPEYQTLAIRIVWTK